MITPRDGSTAFGLADVAALAFTLGFAILAFVVFDPRSLLTLDAAIKWLQAKALVASGYTTVELPNPGGTLDPAGQYLVFSAPFVFTSAGRLHGIFPSSVAALNSVAVPFGLGGVAALSVGSAGLVLLAISRSVSARTALGTVILMAAATPLWFYSILPWEHVPALGLAAWGAVLAQKNRVGSLVTAGLLLGVSSSLRDEFLVLAAILVGLAAYSYGWRRAVPLACGCLVPILLVAAADGLVFDRPMAAHLGHAVGPLGAVLSGGAALPRLADWSPALRYQVAVVDWIFGFGPSLWPVSVGLITAVASTYWVSDERRGAAVLGTIVPLLVLLAHDLKTYSVERDFAGGLLRLSPVLAFAALPAAPTWRSSLRRRLSGVVIGCFVAVVLMTLNTDGGPQLGPRLLLPVLPFAVLAAWEGLASYRHSPTLGGRLVWGLGVLTLVGSMAMQVLGALAYYRLNSEERAPVAWVRAAAEQVLVIDSMFTLSVAVHGFDGRSVLVADGPLAVDEVTRVFRDRGVQAFVFIARERRPDPVFEGFTLTGVQATSYTRVLHWVRDPGSDRELSLPAEGERGSSH